MRSAAVRLLLAAKNSLLGVKALHMNLSPRGIAMVLEGPDEATIERAHVELQKHLDEERPHAG